MSAESGRTGAVVMMRAQQRFASWAADVLVDIVVLNLFVEFVDTLASLLCFQPGRHFSAAPRAFVLRRSAATRPSREVCRHSAGVAVAGAPPQKRRPSETLPVALLLCGTGSGVVVGGEGLEPAEARCEAPARRRIDEVRLVAFECFSAGIA